MIKQVALMESLSSNLHDFLKPIGQDLSLPGKKFLRDSFIGLVRAGKPIVCQMARQMPNHRAKFVSRRDRLEQHLTRESDFDDTVKLALPQVWLPMIEEDMDLELIEHPAYGTIKEVELYEVELPDERRGYQRRSSEMAEGNARGDALASAQRVGQIPLPFL